jgi:hypothetical protein
VNLLSAEVILSISGHESNVDEAGMQPFAYTVEVFVLPEVEVLFYGHTLSSGRGKAAEVLKDYVFPKSLLSLGNLCACLCDFCSKEYHSSSNSLYQKVQDAG